ncbi:MAG TPA: sigma-54-dependent Fis family transcriptional regulator [Planctomycetes bacterium]|nr:sigma-54-dependent Fis family transcriptional regulator [Planctomycetota bacterium]
MALTGRTVWRRQAILGRIQQALNAFMTLQKVDWDYDVRRTLDEILALAVKEIDLEGEKDIERALLLVTPPGGGPLEVRAGYKTDEDVSFSHTIVQETITKAQAVLCANAREDPRFANAESIRSLEVLSCISVPLRAEQDILGAVYVESRSPRSIFVGEDVVFLEEFARAITPYAKTAITYERHVREIRKLRDEVAQRFGFENIVGRSPAMARLFDLTRIAAQGDQLVLITGESGSGKELLARAIHYNGPRRSRPLVVVDCSALTEQLLESELFGHTRGAFTGASADKIGAFEEANGGTVLLDEISDASKPLQQKLRRVLQEGEIRPVGSAAFKKVDVRVIAATNKDLRREMEENRFLRDLYFRLNRFPIAVPPLRERPEDIPLLALHFLRQAPQRRAVPVAGISPDAMQYLVAQRWQDNNVRELRNVIELACDLASGDQIDRDALRRTTALLGSKADGQSGAAALCVPFEELVAIDERRFDALFAGDDAKPFRAIEREFMGKVIIATLKRCEWKLRRAARMLGLSPGKVREDLRDYLKAVMASDRDGAAPAAKLDMPAEILARKIADLGLGEE